MSLFIARVPSAYYLLYFSLFYKKRTLFYSHNDVATSEACRPWIFFIIGVLCFLKFNGSGMEKE